MKLFYLTWMGRKPCSKSEIWRKNGESERNEKAVIVMVTAIADRDNITTAFSAGCDDYVVKPFDNKGIIQRFRKSRLRDRLLPAKGTDTEIENPIDLVH